MNMDTVNICSCHLEDKIDEKHKAGASISDLEMSVSNKEQTIIFQVKVGKVFIVAVLFVTI